MIIVDARLAVERRRHRRHRCGGGVGALGRRAPPDRGAGATTICRLGLEVGPRRYRRSARASGPACGSRPPARGVRVSPGGVGGAVREIARPEPVAHRRGNRGKSSPGRPDHANDAVAAAAAPAASGGPPRRTPPPPQATAGHRLNRLLAILVYLARVGEARVPELAARFSVSAAELLHDLELAACCGLPPYTPDQLIDLLVDEDRVVAEGLRELAHPRRLTPEEGFALAAAARALRWPCPEPTKKVTWRGRSPSLRRRSAPRGSPWRSTSRPPSVHSGRRSRPASRSRSTTSARRRRRRRHGSSTRVRSSSAKGKWYLDGWGPTRRVASGASRSTRVRSVRPTGLPAGDGTSLSEAERDASSCPEAFLWRVRGRGGEGCTAGRGSLCGGGTCHR